MSVCVTCVCVYVLFSIPYSVESEMILKIESTCMAFVLCNLRFRMQFVKVLEVEIKVPMYVQLCMYIVHGVVATNLQIEHIIMIFMGKVS